MGGFVNGMAAFWGGAMFLLSDLAFAPALHVLWERRRHFEIFIGVLQILSALVYNFGTVSGYRGGNFIIAIDDWHRISDIAAETYACLLCIHITGIRSEDRAHLLRYVAFFCCWVAKLGDGWGSVLLKVLVVAAFAVPALACLLGFVPARPGWRPLKYADAERTRGLAAGLAALLLLAADQMLADDGFMSTFAIALQEVAGAFAAYNLWTAAPTGKRGGGFLGERD